MTEPRTEAGRTLLAFLRRRTTHGNYRNTAEPEEIAAIEAEATAAAEQRLRERIEALVSVRFGGGPALLHRAEVLGLLEPQAALASDPASPSEPAIPLHQGAASPRQGEPVEGLDVAWREAEAALPDGWAIAGLYLRRKEGVWRARAYRIGSSHPFGHSQQTVGDVAVGNGPTPEAAVLDLAQELRLNAACGDDSWDRRYACVKPKGHPTPGPGLTDHDYRRNFRAALSEPAEAGEP